MNTLLLPHFTTKRSVPISSIEYLTAMGNYTTVYLVGQKPMLVAITLKRLSERLPSFLRIHKGTLVNPDHIVAYGGRYSGTPFIKLSEDRQLLISRRQTKRLRPLLVLYKVDSAGAQEWPGIVGVQSPNFSATGVNSPARRPSYAQ